MLQDDELEFIPEAAFRDPDLEEPADVDADGNLIEQLTFRATITRNQRTRPVDGFELASFNAETRTRVPRVMKM